MTPAERTQFQIDDHVRSMPGLDSSREIRGVVVGKKRGLIEVRQTSPAFDGNPWRQPGMVTRSAAFLWRVVERPGEAEATCRPSRRLP